MDNFQFFGLIATLLAVFGVIYREIKMMEKDVKRPKI